MNARKRTAGFSLLELMIVVAVAAILAVIAYPSYQNHVTKTWRGNAGACLTELAQALERRYTSTMDYSGALPVRGCMSEADMDDRYNFVLASVGSTSFRLEAQPQGAQASNDTQCGTLSLDERGNKGADGDPGDCW